MMVSLFRRYQAVVMFGLVGGIGFLTDAGTLSLLHEIFGWGSIEARAVSFPVAVTVTWLLNRNLTFSRSPVTSSRYIGYFLLQGLGALVNFAIFSALVRSMIPVLSLPVPALAVGSAVSMFLTFFGCRLVIFAESRA
ncbi:GtrA family protein [Novispirillum itersonii]|uniref:Putative flippase GtrA n=1 Tax=Novispirillum itersonii TaxID=189 RepID=A0A7X0DLW2_NOVIT|nr:GtrA family protein [Novispirillum itersonii]MBB6210390.1 putative flippase GtrA [Novispirillum itersonii]